jgi:Bacterial PH domain
VLFAAANLIDLAIQGRDHLSVVAAFSLLAVTGVVYVTARRPRIVADADGLTIVNPVRVHRVGWAAFAERAEKARAAAPDAPAVPPVSSWHWAAIAAIAAPVLALLIAVLA